MSMRAATLRLMHLIDEQFVETPWYSSRQTARHLRRNGWCAGAIVSAGR